MKTNLNNANAVANDNDANNCYIYDHTNINDNGHDENSVNEINE